jgi:azurin
MRRYLAVAAVMVGNWVAMASAPAGTKPPEAKADPCLFKIYGTDTMMFMDAAREGKKVDKIEVPASCKTFVVHMYHSGSLPLAAMGHSWLLVDPDKFNEVNTAAINAGPAKHYLPQDRTHVLAGSHILLGGGPGEPKEEKITIEISKLPKKKLKFFCPFPGHFAMMSGDFVVLQ